MSRSEATTIGLSMNVIRHLDKSSLYSRRAQLQIACRKSHESVKMVIGKCICMEVLLDKLLNVIITFSAEMSLYVRIWRLGR